jgi:hypothetical protein
MGFRYQLKSRTALPPGGFSFTCPSTGRDITSGMVSFESSVRQIVAFRIGNPGLGLSTNLDEVREELDAYTVKRLKQDAAWCLRIQTEDDPKKKESSLTPDSSPPQAAPGSGVLLAAVSHAGVAARTISDWLGEGGMPVLKEVAHARAETCMACPLRSTNDGWFAKLAEGMVQAIFTQEKARITSGHVLDLDKALGFCSVCGCYLSLKVWVPSRHILEYTSPEDLSRFHSKCWIPKEL